MKAAKKKPAKLPAKKPRKVAAKRTPLPEKTQKTFNFKSKYDAAQTTAENRRHWTNADALSATSSNTSAVRKTLRERARYERDNDPHLNGLIKTLAYDFIGTGPRLQLQFEDADYEKARAIEASWNLWCRAVGLADKLRVMHEARVVDGEVFALLTTNPKIAHPVKLDIRLIETDRVTASVEDAATANDDDGITYDEYGNPVSYRVLDQHPGNYTTWSVSDEATDYETYRVIHWFRPTRAEQTRGVSELAPILPIGAQTRRYASAVISAAEFAACISGVMKTNGSASDDVMTVETLDEVEMVRNALLTLPEGWDATQFKSENPTSTYNEFITDKRGELGRPVLAPQNVVTGNSSGYNYSSGRLDHIPYHRSVWIERERARTPIVDRIFIAWLIEASVRGIVDDGLQPYTLWNWDWQWDGFASLDPLKDATAIEARLRLGLTTLSEECAAEGKNWRDVVDQQAVEKAYMKSKGLVPYGEVPPPKPMATPVDNEPADLEEEEVDA